MYQPLKYNGCWLYPGANGEYIPVQSRSRRLLLRCGKYIEGMAAFLTETALGHDHEAIQTLNKFCIRFGRNKVEQERRFGHFIAFQAFKTRINKLVVILGEDT